MMIHHYNCLLFIITPPLTDVYMILERKENAKRGFGQQNLAEERPGVIVI